MKLNIRRLILAVIAVAAGGHLCAQTLTDIGSTAPSPGANDISQLSTSGNQTSPDGLNYYTDNNPPAGQTFTTGTSAMNLVSVAIKTAGLNSGGGYGTPATTPTYYLRIYSVSGSTATHLISFSAPNPGFSDGDWLKWSGINVPLEANKTYAFTFGRQPSSGGYAALAVATNAYAGGEIALSGTSGGTITTGNSHSFDAVFSLGLQAPPPAIPETMPLPTPTYGWNLGNTLEATWGVPNYTAAPFYTAANAGFNAVRIPCAWDFNSNQTTYQINPSFMAQVKQTVDWAIASGMYVVINDHWDGGWLENNIGTTVDPTINAKMQSYWTQIATAFAGYDNHLLFAGANEPNVHTPAEMNTLMVYYQTFVNAVRGVGGNNTNRWLVLQGGGDTSWLTALPTDSTPNRLMVEYHCYTPSQFAILSEDAGWGIAQYYWGPAYHYSGDPTRNCVAPEEGAIDAGFQQLTDQYVSKGIPVLIGEFGVAGKPTTGEAAAYSSASSLYWIKYVVDSAHAHGLSPFNWSTPSSIIDWTTGAVTNAGAITALTGGTAPPPPNGAPYAASGLTATASGTGQVNLSWTSGSGATSYDLYRAAESGYESSIAPIVTAITGTSYTDAGLNNGTTYYYQVVAVNGSGDSGFSPEANATTPGVNPDPTQYHFETDTQRWSASGSQIAGVATSTAQHYAGNQSLAVNFSGTAAGTSSVDLGDVAVVPGTTITFHVWIPGGSQITTVEPYLQDYYWAWSQSWYGSLTANAWNTLTLTVPSTATTPLKRLGIRFTTSAAWSGTCYIDSVAWPTLPPPVPTNLEAVAGSGQVTLNWSASAAATYYYVKRSTTSGSGYATIATTGSLAFTDTGLVNGTTYYYVVAASNFNGVSSNSTEASATLTEMGAHYAFEGNAQDSGGNGNHGTATALSYVTGRIGAQAAQFNGASSYVSIPRSVADDFTVAMWVKTTDTAGSAGAQWWNGKGLVDGEVGGGGADWGTALVDGKFVLGVGSAGGDTTIASSVNINDGAWHHIAATRNNTSGAMAVYVDGVLLGSGTGPTGSRTFPPSLRIGSLQTGANFLNGTLDDVRLYDRVLTATELTALASGTVPSAPTGVSATGDGNVVSLGWNPSSLATRYSIKRSGTSGGPYATIATDVTTSSYTDSGLTFGATYYYVVSSLNEYGESPDSSESGVTIVSATTLTSIAVEDGYVRESSETSNVGSTATTTPLRAGDDQNSGAEKQVKAIVSFDTSSLPDNAVITSAVLKMKASGTAGTSPFTSGSYGTCYADIKGGSGFSGSTTLQTTDFEAAADATQVAVISDPALSSGTSTGTLDATGRMMINKTSTTQFRVYFTLDDNDNGADDYIDWYPGDDATSSNRPVLEITYTVPGPVPAITSATMATGTNGSAFSYTITASNSPASFGASGLPAGLSVNTGSGLISGTPTVTGTFAANISASNAGGTGNATLTITVLPTPPVITSALSKTGTNGSAFSYTITASNSPASFGASGLPAGLSVNTGSGLISGTPTVTGTFAANISASNAGGTGNATLTITVLPTPPVITSALSKTGTNGSAFSYTITASNSPASFGASGLPASLSVNTGSGLISGTPTVTGTFAANISATNAGGTGNATLTITVLPTPPVITSALSKTGTNGSAFSYTITASNSPASFGASGLPAGLSVNTGSGLISGTPTVTGTFAANISASNAGGTGNATLTITVLPTPPVITSALSKTGTNGSAFSYTITASNSPASFGASGLPAGLGVNTGSGLISGTPTVTGTFAANISASNAGGTGNATLTITVLPTPPVINSATTATGTNGAAFSYQIAATSSPTSYGASGLPAGLSVNTGSGLISGTPTVTGTFAANISATNAGGTGNATLTITLLPAAPAAPAGLTATGSNAAVALNWSASGGATSYTVWRSLTSGSGYAVLAGGTTAATSYTDSGLANGTTYYYVVQAVNAGGSSGNSNEADATTLTAQQSWRLANFGTIENSGSAADTADPDGDGSTNAEEFAAGTNPNDPASVLKVSQMQASGNDMLVSFPSVVEKTYRVERSGTLQTGSWTAVQDNIAGTGGTVQVTDPGGAASGRRFYRVVAW